MAAPSKRMLQLGEEIREVISTMLVRGDISDPRVKNITIHSVKVTPDLQIAKIYFSTAARQSEEAKIGLRSASGFVRKELSKILKLRYTPELHFYYDDSIDHSEKMLSLISEVSKEWSTDPHDDEK